MTTDKILKVQLKEQLSLWMFILSPMIGACIGFIVGNGHIPQFTVIGAMIGMILVMIHSAFRSEKDSMT